MEAENKGNNNQNNSNRGGKRFGAGRKKGSHAVHTIEASAYRQALIDAIVKHKQPIIDALIRKALKGDVFAIKELHERALGKVTQPVDVGMEQLKAIQQTLSEIVSKSKVMK